MNSKESEDLIKSHPHIFRGIDNVECGVGWLTILNYLCDAIEARIELAPIEIQHSFYAVQIKEKFGTLRFYMNHEDDYMSGAIRLAESMSIEICEECGSPGRLRHSLAWIRTLCDAHFVDNE